MRRLKTHDQAPPMDNEDHSYRFTHETGHVSYATDYWTWEKKIMEHRKAMGLPIPPNMMEIAEDQLCSTLPAECCIYDIGDKPPVRPTYSFGDVANWVKAVVGMAGEEYIDIKEATRRAEICVRCPYNMQVEGGCGGGCQKLVELLTPGMRSRKTYLDEKLKSCGVCHCYNRVQIHFPLAVLQKDDTPERRDAYPDFCWKKSA